MNDSAVPQWSRASLDLGQYLDEVDPYVKGTLKVLQKTEAILEEVLDLVKAFLAGGTNVIKSLVLGLLALVRLLISQIKSAGVYILPMVPDISRNSLPDILASVSGGYRSFESKLISKLQDTNDLSAPNLIGPNLGFLAILYVGAASAADLIPLVAQIAKFLDQTDRFASSLPPPSSLTAKLAYVPRRFTLGDRIAFTNSLNFTTVNQPNCVVLEWELPSPSPSQNTPGLISAVFDVAANFTPDWILERSESADGEYVSVKAEIPTSEATAAQVDSGQPITTVLATLLDVDKKTPFKFYSNRRDVTSQVNIGRTYRFVDRDVKPGLRYYYRVRGVYTGSASDYITNGKEQILGQFLNKPITNTRTQFPYVEVNNTYMSLPSPSVSIVVPPKIDFTSGMTDPYKDIYRALMLGLLLGFELPGPVPNADPVSFANMTGWGTMSSVAGLFTWAVPSTAINRNYLTQSDIEEPYSQKFVSDVSININLRRLLDQILPRIFANTVTLEQLNGQWSLFKSKIDQIIVYGVDPGLNVGQLDLSPLVVNVKFDIPPYSGSTTSVGYTDEARQNLLVFFTEPSTGAITKGLPLATFSVEDRRALSSFIRTALSTISVNSSYLSWYKVSLSDLFVPSLARSLSSIEQYVANLVQAADDLVEYIEKNIAEILMFIKRLEKVIQEIDNLITALSVVVEASVLTYASDTLNVSEIIQALQSSTNKPGTTDPDRADPADAESQLNFGLYSALVVVGAIPSITEDNAVKASFEATKKALTFFTGGQ